MAKCKKCGVRVSDNVDIHRHYWLKSNNMDIRDIKKIATAERTGYGFLYLILANLHF